MQNLWALLMLLVIASGMFALNPSVFAQESSEQSMNEDMMVGESASSNSTENDAETTTDDATNDSETMAEPEDYAETNVDSPREQLMKGVDPHQIQCDAGMQLAFRANTFHPVCLKEATYQILSQRGWVSSHDPTHEELTTMLSAMPKVTDESMDESDAQDTTEDSTEGTTDDTSDDTVKTQSFQVNLQESMDMGTK
ncbi:MAG: hypothetical protein ACKOCQ_00440 [Candidatus Nitrosotenuis sp.]